MCLNIIRNINTNIIFTYNFVDMYIHTYITVCSLICWVRSLEHSTILYESPFLTPLLRIIWNKQVEYVCM